MTSTQRLVVFILAIVLSAITESKRLMTSRMHLIKSDQFHCYTPSPHLYSGNSETCTLPSSQIHQADTQYFVVLSGYGFAFSTRSCIYFSIAAVNPTQISVKTTCSCGNRIARVIFYLVAINPNTYTWMSMFEALPENISLSSTTILEELF